MRDGFNYWYWGGGWGGGQGGSKGQFGLYQWERLKIPEGVQLFLMQFLASFTGVCLYGEAWGGVKSSGFINRDIY